MLMVCLERIPLTDLIATLKFSITLLNFVKQVPILLNGVIIENLLLNFDFLRCNVLKM